MGGSTAVTPVIDARGDPELRAKLEAVLGYELKPGSTITVAEGDELVERLERLTALHEAGALTDEEFAEAKRQMLEV